MADRTVLIAGLGGVGYETLHDLCADPRVGRIVAADVAEEPGARRTNAARFKAMHRGHRPRVAFTSIDMLNVDSIIDVLETVAPDVVLTAATVLRYAPFEELPNEERDRLIGFGPEGPGYACILPGQLPLPLNMMRAAAAAEIDAPQVVNVSLPDVVNPALARAGYAPLVGAGNVGHLVPPIQHIAGELFDAPAGNVTVYLAMMHSTAHSILFHNTTAGMPYYAKILVDGADVTEELDLDEELRDRGLPFPRGPTAREVSTLTGTLSARIIGAIIADTGETIHAPGPNGLVGGYPVRLSRDAAEVVLPNDITLSEAKSINRAGLPFEGVDRIEDNGTIVFTDRAQAMFDESLGVDVKRFEPDEALDLTEDIIRGYRALADRHNIDPKLAVTWNNE